MWGICQNYSCFSLSVFLQLGVGLCSSLTSFLQMACVFPSQQIFSSGMCIRAEPGILSCCMGVTSWVMYLKYLNPATDLLGRTLKSFIWTESVPLYQGNVTYQYQNFGNTAVLLTSTWACFLLGGANAADHVAAWPSGYSLIWRGCGSGRALRVVACNPILVGKQNCHSLSYPVFRAHEADGPPR